MSERHRALPPWMSKKEEKVKEKEPLKTRRKRKAARAAFYCMNEKELVEAAVSYLANCAREDHVALLTDQKVEDKTGDTIVKMSVKTAASKSITKPVIEASEEESSDCGDDQESTYVSETDLDMTEVQTVPYTEIPQHQRSEIPQHQRSEIPQHQRSEIPQHQRSEGQSSGPAQDHSSLVSAGLQAEKREAHSQKPEDAVEDDALRLVREIFFT